MRLLKTSFLLAAAATATQLDATDYLAVWNLYNGNIAKATIGVDPSFSTTSANIYNGSQAWLTKLDMVITNPSNTVLFSSTKANVSYFNWNPTGHNLATTEINAAYLNNFRLNSATGDFLVGFLFGSFTSFYGSKYDGMYNIVIDSFGPAITGVSDVAAWMSSINDQNRVYTVGATLAGLPLEGAHHRPMMSFDRMGKEHQAWATGDFGSSSRTRDVHVTTGEAGLNWNAGQNGLFGFALGHGEQNADLAFSGSSATKGDYALAEFDYRPGGSQWVVSLLGMVGSWESKINRGYTSGGSSDFSYGVADLITRSARLRVDAPSLATLGGFGFAPYASYTVTQTVVGAYTETGGGFPASFDEQTHNSIEARAGVTATKDLDAQTKLLLTVEAIHRFDGAGPGLTGQDVTGGVAFSLPGTAPRNNYVRFGFDIDRKLNENTLLNISAHTSTIGEEQDVSAAISIRRAF